MAATCDYCHGACAEGAIKCGNCGAPLGDRPAPDYRVCPFCQRRLLALGSPACNYCGRSLPESYVKAREATLQRISETNAGGGADADDLGELEEKHDDAFKRALRSLFSLGGPPRRK
jgi:hypothetical protein